MSEQFVTTTKHFRKLLAAGYLLIVLLVGGIICTWLGEWRDLELLERENREINRFRKETHDAYVGVVELSLLGESVLEWDDKDVAAYRRQRMTVDSMLCRFKSHYESVRIETGCATCWRTRKSGCAPSWRLWNNRRTSTAG